MLKYQTWIAEFNKLGHSSDDIAAALIKLELHKQIAEEDKLIDKGRPEYVGGNRDDRGDRGGRGDREKGHKGGGKNSNFARLFINVGRKDKIGPKDIVGALTGETGINGRDIGQIDIFDKFSFVEVPREEASHIIKKMKKVQIRGQKINMEEAEDRKY